MLRTVFPPLIILACAWAVLAPSAPQEGSGHTYEELYRARLSALSTSERELVHAIEVNDPGTPDGAHTIKAAIHAARVHLKAMDLWLRYLAPTAYKRINGPLPVEWEAEAHEKHERPRRVNGAGLSLAELYLDEGNARRDSLRALVHGAEVATQELSTDAFMRTFTTPEHLTFCTRLFLLNLAAIYTTGFECPDTTRIVPELRAMISDTRTAIIAFGEQYPTHAFPAEFLQRFGALQAFVNAQPNAYGRFDHFHLIRDHVDPLFGLLQEHLRAEGVTSRSVMDYALSPASTRLFGKDLYHAQDPKGIFRRVQDTAMLREIDRVGRLLFNDPILSGNGQRSCASCHRPSMWLTDTTVATASAFDRAGQLPRNTPTLINAVFHNLLMLDGKHRTLQEQAHAVMRSTMEMNAAEAEVLRKVLSCPEYAEAFERIRTTTPRIPSVSIEHVISAITLYYGKYSTARSPFDRAMDEHAPIDTSVVRGFDLFMGKARCATCHFVPQFNGSAPPFTTTEFEVIGTPADTAYRALSADVGRYAVNPSTTTMHAFRTGSLRNIARTAPYMHNGVFRTLEEVMAFYNAGGGAGKGLDVPGQTLPSDSLHLSPAEQADVIAFLRSLNEDVIIDSAPIALPASTDTALNARRVGGMY